MLWRSSISVNLLESAVAKNALANPLECALTKLLDLKPFGICSYKKCGGGDTQNASSALLGGGRCGGAGNRQAGGSRGRNCSPMKRQKRYMLTPDLNGSGLGKVPGVAQHLLRVPLVSSRGAESD